MTFSYLNVLHFCNKHLITNPVVTYSDLIPKFKLNNTEINNLINDLLSLNLIIKVSDTSFTTTYKGKHAISSYFIDWFFKYIVSIIALIVSVIALVFSTSP